jgi:hypothetical protein
MCLFLLLLLLFRGPRSVIVIWLFDLDRAT